MPSTGAAEEIHDEENDGYDYDDDEFEVQQVVHACHICSVSYCQRESWLKNSFVPNCKDVFV